MDNKEKKDFRDIQEDMEIGEDWSILDEDLMFTGVNNYLQKDESSKVIERMKYRMKYKH